MIQLLIKLQLHLCILAFVTTTGSNLRSMAHIDNNFDKIHACDNLCKLYNIQPIKLRWQEHVLNVSTESNEA